MPTQDFERHYKHRKSTSSLCNVVVIFRERSVKRKKKQSLTKYSTLEFIFNGDSFNGERGNPLLVYLFTCLQPTYGFFQVQEHLFKENVTILCINAYFTRNVALVWWSNRKPLSRRMCPWNSRKMDITYLENMSSTTRNCRYWLFLSAGGVTSPKSGQWDCQQHWSHSCIEIALENDNLQSGKKRTIEKFKFAGPILTLA